VIRALFTGEVVNFEGKHYLVEHARLYTLPTEPPPIYVSAFGPKAIEVAARIGDGLITTKPAADDVKAYRQKGGKGPAQGGVKVCYGADKKAAQQTAHRLWANSGVPGEMSQVLRTPEHFMQVSELVTEEMTAESVVCGDDVDEHVQAVQEYLDAGLDEVYVSQMGDEQKPFFDFYAREVLPLLRKG
jgi:G6PDH family F420-dependent oxidoreductase